MTASLASLGCYADLGEWTRQNLDGENATLTPSQEALLESAKWNLVVGMATFGLIDHPVFTQYLYRTDLGLTFRSPYLSTNGSAHASEAHKTPGLLPESWQREAASYNYIDIKFVNYGRLIFARRVKMRLLADSNIPARWRARLRDLPSRFCVLDPPIEKLYNRYLQQWFKRDVAFRRRMEIRLGGISAILGK